ncbi:MAG: hypothetical protein U0841_11100 [Chloroflexia bacterium]
MAKQRERGQLVYLASPQQIEYREYEQIIRQCLGSWPRPSSSA